MAELEADLQEMHIKLEHERAEKEEARMARRISIRVPGPATERRDDDKGQNLLKHIAVIKGLPKTCEG